MADDLKRVGLVFKEDGAVNFRKSLQEVNIEMNKNYNQFKLTQSQWDKSTKSTEKLKAEQEYLGNAIEIQGDRVEVLRRQLEELENAENKDITAIKKKQNELTSAEIKLKNYEKQLKDVTGQLNNSGKAWEENGKKLEKYGSNIQNAGKKMMGASTGIAALGTGAIVTATNFEDAMRQVAATMGITADEIANGSEAYKILEDAAKQCGENTKYSASEAAEALNYLALAGYDAQKSAETLPKILNLAAAGNLDLATASDMVTDAMAALNMETKDLDKYIDEMAKTSQKSNTSVGQLGEATLTCAGTVKLANMSLETMNAELGILANNGIKGAEGGTHLRNIILSLTSPTDVAAKALKNLGIKVTDSSGNIRDMNDIMADFNKKLAGMSDEKKTNIISQIFNKTDISAVNALIKGSGEEFANLKKEISNSSGAAQDMADTMNSSLKGQLTLVKSQLEAIAIKLGNKLMPIVKDCVKKISDLATWFSNLNDKQAETVLKIAGIVAAAGPLLVIVGKITSLLGSGIKTIGVVNQAIGVMGGTITSTSMAVNGLAAVFGTVFSPVGAICLGVTAAVAGIAIAVQLAEKDSKEAFSNMGNAANDFISGIDNAQSHLNDFNSTLFVSSQEQQELQTQMDEVQQGITGICKTASDERRGYTQEEITQLDEYFTKLRELNQREIEIQQAISDAITQQAVTNSQTFQGTLEEYKTQSQEWIKTAEEQKTKTIELIEKQSIEMVALLNQRYGEQANIQNEAYATEYNNIMAQKQSKIDVANAEVAEVSQAYTNGYLERAKQSDGFYNIISQYNSQLENENTRHNSVIDSINNNAYLTEAQRQQEIQKANEEHSDELRKVWKKIYKDMDESQEEQLGVWLANVAQTELYGGQIDDETQKIVDSILESYDSMPKGTRESMENAMKPMLEEMEKKEPSLFAKASGIANGILSRLNKAFDIHSPSRKTREIFKNVMLGMEKGIEEQEKDLYNKTEDVAENVMDSLNGIQPNTQVGYSFSGSSISNAIDYNKLSSVLTNSFLIALNKCKLTLDEDGFARIVKDELYKVV